ncbi:prolipoprotein diacylglyceryl transferase [Teredinibacter purpureus]|uniref:prolipoprotein diacylglyceryl transferase n=1 Tax=Teredinibacter purpureus TaxID=2731756 RepID=UPI0005F7AEE3|nr:prolipoprotein diacylglyceryl transferase [Teredinibacter purpureus]
MIWNFDPVLFSYGPISIHWYGAIFAFAITAGFLIAKNMFRIENRPQQNLDNLLVYVVAGVIIGARLAHCFFYDPQYYLSNPVKILTIWEGGLASHGGGLGAITGILVYSKKYKVSFIWLLDRIVIPAALFGFFVRIANFLNSEVVGSKLVAPWAITFEKLDGIPRHPAQLYEATGYLMIFLLLFFLYTKTKIRVYPGAIAGGFLTMTFTVRFFVEFVKEPQASYSLDFSLNTGQILSLPFMVIGAVVLISTGLRARNGL